MLYEKLGFPPAVGACKYSYRQAGGFSEFRWPASMNLAYWGSFSLDAVTRA
jgi:hypothetical protein